MHGEPQTPARPRQRGWKRTQRKETRGHGKRKKSERKGHKWRKKERKRETEENKYKHSLDKEGMKLKTDTAADLNVHLYAIPLRYTYSMISRGPVTSGSNSNTPCDVVTLTVALITPRLAFNRVYGERNRREKEKKRRKRQKKEKEGEGTKMKRKEKGGKGRKTER